MQGIIYRIVCNTTGEQYIGSTTKSLKKRMNGHTNKKNSSTSKQIIDRNNYHVQVIEQLFVYDKSVLHQYEAYHIKNNVCVNKLMPFRSEEEKKELTRDYQRGDKFKIYTKNYYKVYNSKFTESIKCGCGGGWKYACDKKKHLKTKRHNIWEASQQQKNTEVIDN